MRQSIPQPILSLNVPMSSRTATLARVKGRRKDMRTDEFQSSFDFSSVLSFAGFPPTPREAAIAPSPPPAFFFLPAGTGGGAAGEADFEVVESRQVSGFEFEAGVVEEESGPNNASSVEDVGLGLTGFELVEEVERAEGFSDGCKAK